MARSKPRPTSTVPFPRRRTVPRTPNPGARDREARTRAALALPASSRDEAKRLCSAGLAVDRGGALVLTPRGRRELAALLRERPAPPGPAWDARSRTLSWGGKVVKRLHREAPAQQAILAAFEAAGWPARIDDPRPGDHVVEPAQRLRDTVKNLRRGIARRTIRFRTDGRGRGVRWEAAS